MEDGGAGTSAAKRSRQRRLRSWWRHECQSVRMALNAAAHHHSAEKVAACQKNSGLRAQTSFSAGRPGVLEEPEPRGGAVTDGYVAAPGPLLEVSSMVKGERIDDTALRFLVKKALERQREEEKVQRRKAKEERKLEVTALLAVPMALRTEEQRTIMELSDETHPKRRKKKKRRKMRTPRTSSLRGRARRRQRQVLACNAGFPGHVPLRAGFPSGVVGPEMLGIMVGIDQKDSCALIVDPGSVMCKARFAGFSLRFVFSLVVGRPVGRSVWTRSTIMYLAGFTGDDAPRAVLPFIVVKPMMLGIMAGVTQVEICLKEYRKFGFFWEMTSHVSVFGSLVRQWILFYVSLQRPGLCLRLQKTAENPQLQFIDGRRFSCRGAQADSRVLLFSRPWFFHSCSSSTRSSSSFSWRRGYSHGLDCSSRPSRFPYCFIWWSMSLLRWSCISFVVAQRHIHMVQPVLRTIKFPQLLVDTVIDVLAVQVLQVPEIVYILVVAQRQLPVVLRTIEIPQLPVDTVFDVPGVQVGRVPQVPSWRRQSCSHSCTC